VVFGFTYFSKGDYLTFISASCTKTHARTVELITCNWLKAAKFDPIRLLDSINPVLNETVCDKVVRVLLEVAPKLDCETNGLVKSICNNLGEPEVRSLMQQLMKKRCLVQDEETPLSTSLAFFLRIKCDTSADAIFEAVDDIPSLCNLLNAQTEKLIEFNNSDSYNDMDEDEAAEFEDNQVGGGMLPSDMRTVSRVSSQFPELHLSSIDPHGQCLGATGRGISTTLYLYYPQHAESSCNA